MLRDSDLDRQQFAHYNLENFRFLYAETRDKDHEVRKSATSICI